MTRRLLLLVALIALVLVLGLGTGAGLCKYRYDCRGISGIDRPNSATRDASLLRSLTTGDRHAPVGSLLRGYRETTVARGFALPTDFAFLPNGHVLISEKAGVVRDVVPGRHGSRVVLDLRHRVDGRLYRGIVTVAVDPAFAMNRYVYVLYVVKPRSTASEPPTVARFSRFVLPLSGRARDEKVLIGSVTVPSCTALPSTADCLPSDLDHDGAQLAFGRDRTIYLATGDGGGYDDQVEQTAIRAQDPDSLAGKVLHVTRDGLGLPGNPFWNGDPRANRSKVWATGLRNPFRLTLDPATGTPIVGDVGRRAAEEIDAATRGANLGWPCYEGRVKLALYAGTAVCKAMVADPPTSLRGPMLVVRHHGSRSIVGGSFAPSSFSPDVRGTYLYGDWMQGWIRAVRVVGGETKGPTKLVASRQPGPIAMHVGPDDALYVLELNSGELRRIAYAR